MALRHPLRFRAHDAAGRAIAGATCIVYPWNEASAWFSPLPAGGYEITGTLPTPVQLYGQASGAGTPSSDEITTNANGRPPPRFVDPGSYAIVVRKALAAGGERVDVLLLTVNDVEAVRATAEQALLAGQEGISTAQAADAAAADAQAAADDATSRLDAIDAQGIESGATADQSGAELVAAINAEPGVQVLDDVRRDKLDGLDDPIYKGQFFGASLADALASLQTAHPTPDDGDVADLSDGTTLERRVGQGGSWVVDAAQTPGDTAAQVRTKLLQNPDTKLLTDAEKASVGELPAALAARVPFYSATEIDVGIGALRMHPTTGRVWRALVAGTIASPEAFSQNGAWDQWEPAFPLPPLVNILADGGRSIAPHLVGKSYNVGEWVDSNFVSSRNGAVFGPGELMQFDNAFGGGGGDPLGPAMQAWLAYPGNDGSTQFRSEFWSTRVVAGTGTSRSVVVDGTTYSSTMRPANYGGLRATYGGCSVVTGFFVYVGPAEADAVVIRSGGQMILDGVALDSGEEVLAPGAHFVSAVLRVSDSGYHDTLLPEVYARPGGVFHFMTPFAAFRDEPVRRPWFGPVPPAVLGATPEPVPEPEPEPEPVDLADADLETASGRAAFLAAMPSLASTDVGTEQRVINIGGRPDGYPTSGAFAVQHVAAGTGPGGGNRDWVQFR